LLDTSSFLDVPESCPDSTKNAADQLFDLALDMNEINTHLDWLKEQLEECSDAVEATLEMMIA